MKIRIVTVALALAALLALCAGAALAEPIAEGEGWALTEDGVLTIGPDVKAYVDNRDEVPWYEYMDQIVEVDVADGVTGLTHFLLCGAENLRTLRLPEGLESIGMSTFEACAALEEVSFPASLKTIDYWAFARCEGLKEIVVGGSMTTLDNYAFQGCAGLKRAVFLEPLERLGYDSLESCTSLKELYLPATLTLIDMYALRDCPQLTDIYFAGTEAQWAQVTVERGSEETMNHVTVHFDSPYDPEAAPVAQDEAAPVAQDQAAPAAQDQAAGDEYSFMDGKLTLRFDPAAYDVYLQDNSGNVKMLESQGLTQEKMDMYMNMLGYQLMAIPAGTPFRDATWRFLLHVKAPAYPGIENLKDFSEAEVRLMGNVLMRGFGVSDWELVQSDAVNYIVFEALNSVRYATIVDECMVYLYISSDAGPVTDEHREALRSIMEGVRWNLD